MGQSLNLIQQICIWAIPVLFAITVHEVAHGWVAKRRGDPTAFMLGRLTLNPLKHIDLVGTVVVPMVLLTLGGFIFGWAKPVPVNPRHFKKPRLDNALVAAAGPLANGVMMLFWAGIGVIGQQMIQAQVDAGVPLRLMASAGIQINLILGLLNLIPIPPLDGSRVLSSFLPLHLSFLYNKLEPYGFLILVLMIVSGTLGLLLSTPYFWFFTQIHYWFGLVPIAL